MTTNCLFWSTQQEWRYVSRIRRLRSLRWCAFGIDRFAIAIPKPGEPLYEITEKKGDFSLFPRLKTTLNSCVVSE